MPGQPLPDKPSVAVLGGGLAGLAGALALGSLGFPVTVYEARPYLGGRATSYPLNTAEVEAGEEPVTIDNCQHVLLRCCHNLMDFYTRLGVAGHVEFFQEFHWIEPGGRMSSMKRGLLPAPLHFTESFAKLTFLSMASKLSVARGLLAVKAEYGKRADLSHITMLDWLREKKQTPQAIDRFWRQVLVSAVNEDLERMAAVHGLQVFYLGFLSGSDSYQMGVPSVPLTELYSERAWAKYPNVKIVHRAPLQKLHIQNKRVCGALIDGQNVSAGAYLLALPFERVAAVAPDLAVDLSAFTHAPITGIHLWFDRPITHLPHATLLDRTIQWMFNKSEGKHIQLVVSASRSFTEMSRAEVVELALRELKDFFPAVEQAKLERSHVVKEMRATFSAAPGIEEKRPENATSVSNLFLAGDWTRTGWPSTMEGAVRSGYLAAEAILKSLGQTERFVWPDAA